MIRFYRFKSFNTGYFSALASSILFGTMPILSKNVVIENSLTISLVIAMVTMLIMIPFASKNTILNLNLLKLTRNNVILVIILALLGTVLAPNIYFIGLRHSSASDAAILSNSEIIFTIILALIVFKEKLIRTNYVALILISVGILIISTKLDFSNLLININEGNILIITSMLMWSFDNNISKILIRKLNPIHIVQIKTTIGAIIIFLLINILNIEIKINNEYIFYTVTLGIISFGLPMLFLYNAIKNLGTILSILILSTSPIFGVIYSVIFLNDKIHSYQVVSILIMIIGILVLYKYRDANNVYQRKDE
ncbi:MAG: DMT family transporter [Thaumarchaeota archaeon]|nr:DMT family transporter [Nitrososphaerota archaeon]MCY3975673.1 DMT family transporter [Nitrososphaerota archaeon]